MRFGRRARRPVAVVHIGAMKTGTTFLQGVLLENRDALRDQGVLVPGGPGDFGRGARDILGLTHGDAALAARVDGVWARLVEEMSAWDGAASVYSMEFLSFARPPKAAEIMRTLRGLDVHVVLTIRDSLGALPAQWQSWSRNRGHLAWPDFALQVRQEVDGPALKTFRRAQDTLRMLDVWAPLVRPDRLHVVLVPPSSAPRSALWERFASVAGIDPAGVDLTGVPSNPSLGYASCDLLRRMNPALTGTPLSRYQRTLRWAARTVLAPRRGEEPRHRLDEATAAFLADWNSRVRDRLASGVAHVVGDLDDLPPAYDPSACDPGERPRDVEVAEVAACAQVLLAGLARRARARDLARPARGSADWSAAAGRGEPVVTAGLDAETAASVRDTATVLRLLVEGDGGQ